MPGSLPSRRTPARRRPGVLLAALLVVLGLAVLTGCAPASSSSSTASATGRGLAPAAATTDLDTMAVAQLPPEGIETLQLIRDGGPFPYAKDGSTFQNREWILPAQPSGFYAEYTVETPGSDDRGARRIIGGHDGSRFYTDDHYSSFREVVSGEGT